MARCRCGVISCSCAVRAGSGITIAGTGDGDNPYVISAQPLATGTLQVADTETLDLTLTGSGIPAAPYVISGQAIIGALIQLVDDGDIIFDVTGTGADGDPLVVSARVRCLDCSDPAVAGDVPTWDAAQGRYVPGPTPTAPFGVLVVEGGLTGAGTAGDPVRADICSYDELAALCETP